MAPVPGVELTLTELDESTRALVRLAAVLAGGAEDAVRGELQRTSSIAPSHWIEELLLQTYLFAGFPRALNGMRMWRRISPRAVADTQAIGETNAREAGERTCRRVYGPMYERLRVNIRELHPLLDDWMITEGYGKVLSRPALDLPRRELCIVAACAGTGQDRQLQSHLHGAMNVGVRTNVVSACLDALVDVVASEQLDRARRMWDRIRNDIH